MITSFPLNKHWLDLLNNFLLSDSELQKKVTSINIHDLEKTISSAHSEKNENLKIKIFSVSVLLLCNTKNNEAIDFLKDTLKELVEDSNSFKMFIEGGFILENFLVNLANFIEKNGIPDQLSDSLQKIMKKLIKNETTNTKIVEITLKFFLKISSSSKFLVRKFFP